jgi:hypothetical protein
MNSTPLTSSTLVITAKNCCTTGSKGRAYEFFAQRLETLRATRPVTVLGAAVIDVIADAYALPWRGCDIELKQQGVNIGGCALNIAIALKRRHRAKCAARRPRRVGRYYSQRNGKAGSAQRRGSRNRR